MRSIIISATAAALVTFVSLPAFAGNGYLNEHIQREIASSNGILNYDHHAHSSRKRHVQAYSVPHTRPSASSVDSRAIERWQFDRTGGDSALDFSTSLNYDR